MITVFAILGFFGLGWLALDMPLSVWYRLFSLVCNVITLPIWCLAAFYSGWYVSCLVFVVAWTWVLYRCLCKFYNYVKGVYASRH